MKLQIHTPTHTHTYSFLKKYVPEDNENNTNTLISSHLDLRCYLYSVSSSTLSSIKARNISV